MAWMVFSSLSPSGMLHYQSADNHAGGLVARTVVPVLQTRLGLAQPRERLLKLKQLVTVVLGVVFHVDSC